MKQLFQATALAFACVASTTAWAEPATLKVLGNFTGNKKQVELVEQPFFMGLPKETGISSKIGYSPMDLVNVKAADALRLLKSGAFDVASVQIGLAARDDPFLEGIDLAGIATNLADQRKVVDAIREEFDREVQTRFNSKVMTLWPFGPQILFCKMNRPGNRGGCLVKVKPPQQRVLQAPDSTVVRPRREGCRQSIPAAADD